MDKKFKKLLAVLLSIVMVFSTASFANVSIKADGDVASVNGNDYGSIQEAIDAANPGDTVTLLANSTITSFINVNKSIVIEGSDYTIDSKATRAIRITESNVDVSIRNLTITSSTKVSERAVQVDSSKTNVSLTIDSCNLFATTYTINVCNYSEVAIDIDNTTAVGWGALNLWGADYTVNVNNSTLIGNNDKPYNAEGWNDFATVILEGDTTGATDQHAEGCVVNLNNCVIEANVETAGNHQYAILFNNPSATNTVNITGEDTSVTYEEGYLTLDQGDGNKLSIEAGTYSDDPSEYVTAGYGAIANANETYTVGEGVAKVNNVLYASLQEAIDEAGSGDTVTLLADITANAFIDVDKSVIIDGGDHTIDVKANRGIRVTTNDVDVTVENLKMISSNNKLERAIQVDGGMTGVTLNIDSCDLYSTYYTINIGNNTEVTLNIDKTTATGWGALNLWGANYNVTVNDSKLIGVNNKSYNAEGWNDFGTVILEGDTTGNTTNHAENCKVVLNNCEIEANVETAGNHQWAILFNNPSAVNSVIITGDNTKVTYNGEDYLVLDQGNGNEFTVCAGTYSYDPTPYLSEGCNVIQNSDQTFTVTVKEEYGIVEQYKGDREQEDYIAPEEEGKVFAGWYTDESCEIPYTGTEGVAYPKFVDVRVLKAKTQIKIGTGGEKDSIRFVTSVDKTDYQRVGFILKDNNTGKTAKKTMSTLYGSLVANNTIQLPTDICVDSAAFVVFSVKNIPDSGVNVSATPYWITADGTEVEGITTGKVTSEKIAAYKASKGY